jgi:hypothetical protein
LTSTLKRTPFPAANRPIFCAWYCPLTQILTGESNEVEAEPEQTLLPPTINIEDVNESEFIKPPPKKKKTPMIGETDQIVLVEIC